MIILHLETFRFRDILHLEKYLFSDTDQMIVK